MSHPQHLLMAFLVNAHKPPPLQENSQLHIRPNLHVFCRFNCSFTNVRSMIGESTDFSSQTVAMGYLGTAFGVGVILGPLIGGALAYPCDNFGAGFPLCGVNQLNAQRYVTPLGPGFRRCHIILLHLPGCRYSCSNGAWLCHHAPA